MINMQPVDSLLSHLNAHKVHDKPAMKSLRILIVFFAAALILSGCGGLASEPEIIRTAALPTVTPTSPPDLGHPPARVNLAHGAEIFGGPQGCALCHGITGKGDGQVAAQISCKLPDFTDVEAARGKTINAWFAITSNGNNGAQTCLMPPWKGRLDEQQRWDVSTYIYSLHYTPDQIAQGQQIWQQKCTECHGERGAGDGPKAKGLGRPVPNFSDPAYLITHSDTDLWKTVTNGLGSAMPAFKDQLDDNARWAVVAYARSLTWEGLTFGAPAATPSATAASTAAATPQIPDTPTIIVSGTVTNATPLASIPAGQPLTLRVIDLSGSTPRDAQKFDGKTAADGSFSFANVQRQNGMVYVITTQYAGVLQTSTPIRLQSGSGPTLDLSFKVYEATGDPAAIQIDTIQMFVEPFSQNTVLVREAISYRNTGDRIFLTDRKTPNGDRISSEAVLPAGATQIMLAQDSQQRYVVGSTPPAIQGIVPITPGESTAVQFSYLLSYTDRPTIPILTTYSIEDANVFVPQVSGFAIQDPLFTPDQPLQLETGVYNRYRLQRPIRPGEPFTVTIVSQAEQVSDRRNLLALVLIIAALALIGTIFAIWRLSRQAGPAQVTGEFDRLVRSIADLDERFEKGQVAQADYDAERARLKAELAKLME